MVFITLGANKPSQTGVVDTFVQLYLNVKLYIISGIRNQTEYIKEIKLIAQKLFVCLNEKGVKNELLQSWTIFSQKNSLL